MNENEAGWVVLRTQPRYEQLVAQAIKARGVDSYIPVAPRQRSDPRPTLLFPGYVFARITVCSNDLLRIRSAPGVEYPLPRGSAPVLVPDSVVSTIRARLAGPPGDSVALRPGERVTLIDGPFRWTEAIFDRHLNAGGRVRVLLELVHRTIQLNVAEGSLRRV